MLFIYLTYLKSKNERQEELTKSPVLHGHGLFRMDLVAPCRDTESLGDLLRDMADICASFKDAVVTGAPSWDEAGTAAFSGDLAGTSTSSAVAVDTGASSWDEAGISAFV